MRTYALCGILLSATAARAEIPTDELVRRTIEAMERRQKPLVCRQDREMLVLGKNGNVENSQRIESEVTRGGETTNIKIRRAWENGKEVSPERVAREEEKLRKDLMAQDTKQVLPFSRKSNDAYSYTVVRHEQLWGHPAAVVALSARRREASYFDGLAWIDSDRLIVLKMELTPAKLPKYVDWMKVQTQYEQHASGVAVPTFAKAEAAAHRLFLKKGLRVTNWWRDCH